MQKHSVVLLSIAKYYGAKGSSSANTLTTWAITFNNSIRAQLQTMNSDALLKTYKKHEADLENIKIYQKEQKLQI